MVQNKISHQPPPLRQGSQVTPIAETLLKARMAGDRKAAITGGLQERQHMNHRCEGMQMAIDKGLQGLKTRHTGVTNRVGVGDQDHITTVPAVSAFSRVAIS